MLWSADARKKLLEDQPEIKASRPPEPSHPPQPFASRAALPNPLRTYSH
jgi:hypothetical protein